jgi:5-methyltetrahydropteroyltriglutamate--homocysteine methyltransferase
MKRSTDRILTMHAGSLPRPDDVREMVAARAAGDPHDPGALNERLRGAVTEVVQQQIDCGIDSINDGELGKTNFTNYANERLGGLEIRTFAPNEGPEPQQISGRDRLAFPGYFEGTTARAAGRPRDKQLFCIDKVTYLGHDRLQAEIANFKSALQGVTQQEPFLPSVAPGSIEHWLWNEAYATQEELVYGIADAMHEEYKAIADAGLVLQIDDPDLFDAWQIHPDFDVPTYRKFAEMRIEALNHALRGIPREQVRLHVCWGSYHGPHQFDIPLTDIVDLFLKVNAQAYSIEASNPRHEHEWRVWENVKLPDGATLIPGVVGHSSDFVEHPELVAERLVRYANIVGRENVMGGTDCGLGTRVGHPDIVWAKFRALSEGARIASNQLWR